MTQADPQRQFVKDVHRVKIDDDNVNACWQLVVRAAEFGLLNRAGLSKLLDALERKEDYATDELMFEHLEESLRVRFVTANAECPPRGLCAAMRDALLNAHPGTITYLVDDRVVFVCAAAELPETSCFADTQNGKIPIVKVVALTMSEKMREVVEYGPDDSRLRSTIQMKN